MVVARARSRPSSKASRPVVRYRPMNSAVLPNAVARVGPTLLDGGPGREHGRRAFVPAQPSLSTFAI